MARKTLTLSPALVAQVKGPKPKKPAAPLDTREFANDCRTQRAALSRKRRARTIRQAFGSDEAARAFVQARIKQIRPNVP